MVVLHRNPQPSSRCEILNPRLPHSVLPRPIQTASHNLILPRSHTPNMVLVEILGRVVQANLITEESVMDFMILTHAGDPSVVFVVVVGAGVDGMIVTMIVSKI